MCDHEPKHAKGLCGKCYRHARYKANPERTREQSRRWREANPEKRRERHRRWVKANPDKYREQHRKWEKVNADKVRERKREWGRANSEKVREAWHRRRARKRAASGSWTAQEWETLKRQYGYRCVSCWKTETELKAIGRTLSPDHIVPLSKGGLNDITNLQPLCHCRRKGSSDGCNNQKSAKTIDYVTS